MSDSGSFVVVELPPSDQEPVCEAEERDGQLPSEPPSEEEEHEHEHDQEASAPPAKGKKKKKNSDQNQLAVNSVVQVRQPGVYSPDAARQTFGRLTRLLTAATGKDSFDVSSFSEPPALL